jgi:hypothetical protein
MYLMELEAGVLSIPFLIREGKIVGRGSQKILNF